MTGINLPSIIIQHKKAVAAVFAILAIISAIATFQVSVNYDMKDYLPDDAPSSVALELMEKEFSGGVPGNRVMIRDVTIQEALQFKEKLASIDGVSDVTWLDDIIDLKTPLEMADEEVVETYYKNGNALFLFSIRDGEEAAITDAIYDLIGDDNAMMGESVNTATQQKMAVSESLHAAALLVPIIFIILVLSTTSWIEPLLFFTAIGVSVIINMGTNIFLGEISFVTQSVAPILQLAVSLDYAIFLLHSFSSFRRKTDNPEKAMELAMIRSFSAIAASASTTFFGFIAIAFMKFKIGSDLGINLVKGILLSFISVMIFLPALTLLVYKWIDKTRHKPFVPGFQNIGKPILKMRAISLIVVFLLVIPCYLAQTRNDFTYGIGDLPENTRAGKDATIIQDEFGESTPIVLLVPKGDAAKEEQLVEDLENLEHVTSVSAYVNSVGAAIPSEILDESVTDKFYSKHCTRIILNTRTKNEGDEAFRLVEKVRQTAQSYYGDDVYTLGESATLYDIKNTVQTDNKLVNLLTILTVAFVLVVTFPSLILPFLLLLAIEAAVWINLSVPYFTNTSVVYVGYLLVSVIQLAATIDYAILFTDTYKQVRQNMPAREALKKAMGEKFFAIVISASIMSSVGMILWITSSNPIVSSVGLLLGRGAILALLSVVFFLPACLLVFDKIIMKTTWKANFYEEKCQ